MGIQVIGLSQVNRGSGLFQPVLLSAGPSPAFGGGPLDAEPCRRPPEQFPTLNLEPAERPGDFIVIDQVERPIEDWRINATN